MKGVGTIIPGGRDSTELPVVTIEGISDGRIHPRHLTGMLGAAVVVGAEVYTNNVDFQ